MTANQHGLTEMGTKSGSALQRERELKNEGYMEGYFDASTFNVYTWPMFTRDTVRTIIWSATVLSAIYLLIPVFHSVISNLTG